MLPFTFRSADLQTRNMLREEQSQTAEVCVAAFRIRLGKVPLPLSSDVINHVPEMVIGIIIVRVCVS